MARTSLTNAVIWKGQEFHDAKKNKIGRARLVPARMSTVCIYRPTWDLSMRFYIYPIQIFSESNLQRKGTCHQSAIDFYVFCVISVFHTLPRSGFEWSFYISFIFHFYFKQWLWLAKQSNAIDCLFGPSYTCIYISHSMFTLLNLGNY